ncbi:MAG: phosphoglycerate dehydrogenase [Actinobacteria bacterium]|nr:phosphoglycerate dehydrogenase [Actinomycetota bacterium]
MKVLVKEKIAASGIDMMRKAGFDVEVGTDWTQEEFLERLGEFDALIVRSGTKVTKEVLEHASNLKVIGRAGIGVDNIDVEEATKRGIIVCNAPQSNIVSAAEHTIALLLSLLRWIPQAHYALKNEHRWERNKFMGVEFTDKIAGVIGLGRVGSIVAQKLRGLGVKVIGYDPYVSNERFAQLGITRAEKLDDILMQSDFITIHLPKTKETMGLIGDREFQMMKDGVYIVNTARGGIIREDSLIRFLKEGKVAGAALDVFEQEPCTESPLFDFENVIVTPHLGASTVEAQDKAGVMIAEQVIAALKGEFVSAAVNIPLLPPEQLEVVKPYLPLAEMLGSALAQIYEGKVDKLEIVVTGRLSETNPSLLTTGVLKGFFSRVVEEPVSYVNAPLFAKERGIQVLEVKSSISSGFHTDEIIIKVDGFEIAGTAVAPHYVPRFTKIFGYEVDIAPSKHILIIQNEDKPGIVGKLGTILGENNINIASMQVGRREVRGQAVSIVIIDEAVPVSVLSKLKEVEGIMDARYLTL